MEAFERLAGTRIKTNIKTNDEEITEGFGLIDSWRVIRANSTGRMLSVKVTLSEWLFNAVLGQEVLTLHRDYFRLRKPVERRVYEIARKHCGKQDEWLIRLENLQKKCGSTGPLKRFRQMVRGLARHDHLPDYSVTIEDDMVRFRNRSAMPAGAVSGDTEFPRLNPETYHDAKTVAPGYDVYYLEREWRDWWVESGKPPLRDADMAFIGFCKRRHEKNPNP